MFELLAVPQSGIPYAHNKTYHLFGTETEQNMTVNNSVLWDTIRELLGVLVTLYHALHLQCSFMFVTY
jgi:acyl-ACP thioesterase